MKILLVKPEWPGRGGPLRYAMNVRFPVLSLGILGALSDGYEVRVVDGDWEPVPYDDSFDVVGITVTTFASERAYEIARNFRKRGAKVILGGVHPSIVPNESLDCADTVVVGEAEYVWGDVLRDAEKGALKPIYKADRPTDMNDVPFPRRDLLHETSWFTSVEATRGCPNSCRYCYLPSVPWRKHRKRPVELVTEEVRSLRQNLFIFVDENLFADRNHAIMLFKAISPLKKSWLVQAPTNIGDDDELLDAMAEAGCFNVHVGFQSFNRESLESALVGHNRVEKYRTLVRKLHHRNIVVCGFFLFGFDSDGPDVFDATVEMIKRIDVDEAIMFAVTPYPGTPFYARLAREGRLLVRKPSSQFGWSNAVFVPKQMTPEELEQGIRRACDRLYPYFRKKLTRIMPRQLKHLVRNPRLALTLISGNLRRVRRAGRA